MKTNIQENWKIVRFQGDLYHVEEDVVATECPFTILVNGDEFSTIVCTPTDVQALVVGFLASEGVIRFYKEIKSLQIDQMKGFVYVEMMKPHAAIQMDHSKRVIGSCCGKSRQFYFKSDVKTAKTMISNLTISAAQCYTLMKDLETASSFFKTTGGVHQAALCTVNRVMDVQTDIGRHNALDKIFGEVLIKHMPVKDKVIVFSGRVSSEVLLKVSKIGVGILISKSAPTHLALQLATDLRITTIGFARGNTMNVYTHPERIKQFVTE